MKKVIFYGLIVLVEVMVLMACGTSPSETKNPTVVLMWRSEVNDYLLSKHDKNNNFVYFFIKKENKNENAYAFIITEQMDESDGMQCLAKYSTAGDIPGVRTTKASAEWYNEYSPVVIQDDYNGISLAAFSLPKDAARIWILVQNITLKNNQANGKGFPLMDFELSEEPEQYYLINASAGEYKDVISSIDNIEMEKYLKRTTFYATQIGTKFQPGYIAGKGQELVLME
jgi:hypothetical protein